MKTILLMLTLTFAVSLYGQSRGGQAAPDATAANLNTTELPSAPAANTNNFDHRWATTPALVTATMPARRPPKTWDKKFLLLTGITTALTIADVELTARCSAAQTCTEVNPMFGSNPKRARLYGISLPVLGGEIALAHWLKRRHPERKIWMMPLIANTAAQAVGTATVIGK